MRRREANPGGEWDLRVRIAQSEVEAIAAGLPGPLAEAARQVPVVFEAMPGPDLLQDGLEPDTLGLFVGIPFPESEGGGHDVPAQILLFLDNIHRFTRGDPRAFRAEVCTTYLHELGHYLGLDEDDLDDRGLQ